MSQDHPRGDAARLIQEVVEREEMEALREEKNRLTEEIEEEKEKCDSIKRKTTMLLEEKSSLEKELGHKTIGTRICKEFEGGNYYNGEVVSGPHEVSDNGNIVLVWKVLYSDGDKEDLTSQEVDLWKVDNDNNTKMPAKKKSKK